MPSHLCTLALLLSVFVCGTGRLPAAERISEHVVLITVDGLPAFLFDDPSAVLPNLRSLAARGVRAEGMTVSNPSVTWPNHTTLVTGVRPNKHGVIFNGVLERPGLGLPVRVNRDKDKLELVKVPTIYDALHAAGGTAIAVKWPCTRDAKGLHIRLQDVYQSFDDATPGLIDELREAGILTDDLMARFSDVSGSARDRVWTQTACHLIKSQKPNLLLLHLVNVDGIHHQYGPKSAAGYSAVAFADACVGEVLRAIKEAGITDSTTVFVASDHGFISIPQSLRPNVLFRQAGLLTIGGKQVETARAYAVPEGGTAMVYLTVPDTASADRDRVIELLTGREGIRQILEAEDYEAYGLPTPAEDRQAPDLVLVAADGYGFSADAAGEDFVVENTGTPGTHGFLSTNPKMNATFVAAGAGIKSGVQLGVVENIDVAPTIARLLAIELPGVDGQPLESILKDGSDE